MRTSSYNVPHKALRNALSQLSLLAGKTDYSNHQEIGWLHKLGLDVFRILTIHAEDENAVTLAELDTRCPGSSQHDMDDHEQIHIKQQNLENILLKIHSGSAAGKDVSADGVEFYLALSEFQGMYLEHTAEEERVTQELLWKHFTDEELAAQRGKIMTKNPPNTLLLWFRFAIPALSLTERVALLIGFKKMAPTPFFEQGMAVVKQYIATEEYTQLIELLS
jgi:hypothetical protein